MAERIFVTGGAGFVGIEVCRKLLGQGKSVTCYDNLDSKTFNPKNLEELQNSPNFKLIKGDILDIETLERELKSPDALIHLAAISSVDRSIKNPYETVNINTVGTLNVMEAARKKGIKRIHYVSTDEVFGQSKFGQFDESSPSDPRNPYAAGKLGAEAIVQAWGNTYGMEITITNSVNNYGPRQVPEKLIPRLCIRGINGRTLPVYGDGKQVREWLFVDDHARAILHVLNHGVFGERYCIGSGETTENITIVHRIIDFLGLDAEAIEYVPDRQGHDVRYALDSKKINNLGWYNSTSFNDGLNSTIDWYKNNKDWWQYFLVTYPDLLPR